MNANELADLIERCNDCGYNQDAANMLRQFDLAESIIKQQELEIEALKNANRFIQNFAQEQHQKAVALEMRELTDEEIDEISKEVWERPWLEVHRKFAKAILRKAQEK